MSSRAGFTDRCQTSYCDKERTTHEKQDQIACGRNDHRAGYGCGKCCHSAGDEAGGRRPRPSRFNSSPFHASSLTRPPPAFRRVRLGRQRRDFRASVVSRKYLTMSFRAPRLFAGRGIWHRDGEPRGFRPRMRPALGMPRQILRFAQDDIRHLFPGRDTINPLKMRTGSPGAAQAPSPVRLSAQLPSVGFPIA